MSRKPKCIIITGQPGSGKTTLAKKLGERLWMPVISRDEIKEGYVNTYGVKHDQLPPDTNGLVSELFFGIVNQYLAGHISVVLEAAFQHKVWEPRMPKILELAMSRAGCRRRSRMGVLQALVRCALAGGHFDGDGLSKPNFISDSSMLKKLSLLSTLLPLILLSISAICQTEPEELYPISRDGKEGYIDRTGRVVVEPKFDIAYYFSEGIGLFATALIKEYPDGESKMIPDKWGLIDTKGEIIAQPQFKSAACVFSEGLLCVGTEAGVGFVDKTGKLVIEPRFSYAKDFSEGLAPVSVGEKWGFVLKNGEIAIPPQFNDANSFSQGLALVKVKEGYAYIDKAGQVVIHVSVTNAGDFHEGLARVMVGNPGAKDKYKEKGRAGYIDTSGKTVIEPQFDDACDFSEGLACVETEGKMGYIDKAGRMIVAPEFDIAQDFSEGLAIVESDGYYGFIDKSGKVVIKPQFSWAGQFSGGLANVMVGDKMGYIDKSGKYVWEPTK